MPTTAYPCTDCVNVHGDDPAAWLNRWPAGAEWWSDYKAHLCDGCADDRRDLTNVEPDAYEMAPFGDY
jgi:hypothetical protein